MNLCIVSTIKGLKESIIAGLVSSNSLNHLHNNGIFNTINVISSIDNIDNDNGSIDSLDEADIILGDPPFLSLFLQRMKGGKPKTLKWIQSTFAGVDALTKDVAISNLLLSSGSGAATVKLTRISNIFGDQMAEYVIGSIINRERHFVKLLEHQKQCQWEKLHHRPLRDVTVGIIGLGDIGSEVARVCKMAFNMKVTGMARSNKRNSHTAVVDEFLLTNNENMIYLFSKSDYIVSILPNTNETTGIYDVDDGILFSHCKNNSTFINVGRGNVIKEETILSVLEKKWLSHAILDVFPIEPLPISSPLWKHPNVTITPHVSALSLTEDVTRIFLSNLTKYLNNQPLDYIVDIKSGY